MSGCVFKKYFLCDYCEARNLIDQAYKESKEVDYKEENGKIKVFIYTKGNPRPKNPRTVYKYKHCTCKD